MIEGAVFNEKFLITDTIYQGFIDLFKDHNPMHTDKDFAASKGHRDVVMHGNILNGFLSYFIGECLPTKHVMIITQDISYHRPFFKGDELSFTAKIKNISSAVGLIEFRFTFRNQLNDKIAKGTIQIKEV